MPDWLPQKARPLSKIFSNSSFYSNPYEKYCNSKYDGDLNDRNILCY